MTSQKFRIFQNAGKSLRIPRLSHTCPNKISPGSFTPFPTLLKSYLVHRRRQAPRSFLPTPPRTAFKLRVALNLPQARPTSFASESPHDSLPLWGKSCAFGQTALRRRQFSPCGLANRPSSRRSLSHPRSSAAHYFQIVIVNGQDLLLAPQCGQGKTD